MKQVHQSWPQHALAETDGQPQKPSAVQSPVRHSSTASKRTHRHPHERHPSTNSKDEEHPERPTANPSTRIKETANKCQSDKGSQQSSNHSKVTHYRRSSNKQYYCPSLTHSRMNLGIHNPLQQKG